MTKSYKLFIIVIMTIFSVALLQAQITIVKTDIDAGLPNTQRIQIEDTLSGTFDLGIASSSSQAFNFSGISFGAFADSAYQDYYPPTGHWYADSFSTATFCVEGSYSSVLGPYTLTTTQGVFYTTENDGIYVLGFAMRQQVSPPPAPGFPFPADTTTVLKWNPYDLVIPLPLTLGTSRTYTSVFTDPGGETETSTKTYTADGFGTMTAPDGRSLSVIRMITDETTIEIDDDDTTRERTKSINFIADDLTILEFEVDTNYTGGATTPLSYDYQKKVATLDVREISTNLPDRFMVAQNYPNPFNPATTIRFMVREAGVTTLKVYNMLGGEVAVLVNRQTPAGIYEVTFDATDLPSGMYIYRFSTGEFVQTRKMILMK